MTGKITILVWDWYWNSAAPPAAAWREVLPISPFIIPARKGKTEGRMGEGSFPKVSTSLLVKLSATGESGEGSNIEISGYGSNWDRHWTACISFTGKSKNSTVHSSHLLQSELYHSFCHLLKTCKIMFDLSCKWVLPNDDFYKNLSEQLISSF